MITFLTHWTKKKVLITASVLALVAGVVFCVFAFGGDGNGKSDVELPGAGEANVVYEKPEGTVADYTSDPKKNLYVANGVLKAAGSFRSDTAGVTITKSIINVEQQIRATRIVKGDDVFKQSSSFGLVKIGDQRMAVGENYLYRTAKKLNSVDDIVWNDSSPIILDKSSFFERYGCRGSDLTSYILTDETIIDSTFDGYDETSETYKFSYVLDLEKATPQILCEMRTNAGTKKYPTFKRAKISVTMDKDWTVKTLETDCEYEVPLMGGQTCEEKMTETFSEIGKIDSIKSCPDYDFFSNFISSSLSPSAPPKDNPSAGDNETPDAVTTLTQMFGKYVEGSPLNANLSLTAGKNDLSLDLTAILDIADLAKTKIFAKTKSGITLSYDDGNVLVKSNDVKLSLSVNDLQKIISDFIGSDKTNDADDNSTGFDLSSFDPSKILDSMTVDSDEKTVSVTIPLELGDFSLTAILKGEKTDDGCDFATAEIKSDLFSGTVVATDTTLPALKKDASFVNVAEVFNDYYPAVKQLILPTAESDDTTTTNRAYSFTLSPLAFDLGEASLSTDEITANLYYSPDATVLDLNEVRLFVKANGKTLNLAFDLKLAIENDTTLAAQAESNGLFDTLTNLLSSKKIFVTAKELGSGQTFRLTVKGKFISDLVTANKEKLLSLIPSVDSIKNDLDVQKILEAVGSLISLDYDRANEKTLSLTVNAQTFGENLGNITLNLSQPASGGISLGLKTDDKNIFAVNLKSLGVPSRNEILSAYDFAATHKDIGDVSLLIDKFKTLSKLLPTVKDIIDGNPVSLDVSATISGATVNATLTAILDITNLPSSVLAVKTARGIQATYADNLVLVAVNNLGLKLHVDDIGNIAETFGKPLPEINVNDLLSNIDLLDILGNLKVKEQENAITIELPITVKDKSIMLSITFIGDGNGNFTIQSGKITVDDLFEATLSSSTLSVSPLTEKSRSFVDIAEVLNDYGAVIDEFTSLNTFDEVTKIKSFDFVLDEFDYVGDARYTIGATTFRLILTENKIVFYTDKLAITTTENEKSSTKELSLKVAYEKSDADGKLYVTINDKVNADSELKFSVSESALDSCINKRFPELLEAVPQLKELVDLKLDTETLLNLSSMISSLTYDRAAENLLSVSFRTDRNSDSLLNGFTLKLSHNPSNLVKLGIGNANKNGQSNDLTVCFKKANATQEDLLSAYDTTAPHISLDSIDTLLESFILTSKRTSFRLTGTVPVNLTALGIVKADISLGLDVRVDVERNSDGKDVVYVAAKLSRGKIDGIENSVFKDDGGDSYIFYDGAAKTITTARNSLHKKKWCKKCSSFDCKKSSLHWGLYFENRWVFDTELTGSYGFSNTLTETEFKSDFVTNFLEIINFIDSINNAIVDATNKEKSPFGIDDIIKDYSYSSPVYTVSVDLKPLDSVLGTANVNISHDENFELKTLTGDIKLLDISGVSCKGTFEIDLVDSIVGDAKSLATNKTVF